jgi:hypothetical protein
MALSAVGTFPGCYQSTKCLREKMGKVTSIFLNSMKNGSTKNNFFDYCKQGSHDYESLVKNNP